MCIESNDVFQLELERTAAAAEAEQERLSLVTGTCAAALPGRREDIWVEGPSGQVSGLPPRLYRLYISVSVPE